ncbi:hypothetical protein PVAP13_9KG205885 [Panicum virgatum]|uniref:Uncharacterized protein n=1 Tax=Panicum virgatum TaxID=38727 RepID=A0A8T0NNZ2_PANVG|nr:hypothetical protein PVAP13_9KG205885 [Panicum virgatum]
MRGRRGTDRGGELQRWPDPGAPSTSAASSPPRLARPAHTGEQARPVRHRSRRCFLCLRLVLTSPARSPRTRRRVGAAGEAQIEAASSGGSRIWELPLPPRPPHLPGSPALHTTASRCDR